MKRRFLTAVFAAGMAAVVVSACTMKKQEAPPLTGPSEFGTSITVQITPDVLTQDGASQAVVSVTARDANGQPVRNLALRVDTVVNGVTRDFGTLSAKNVVTGSDGRATLTYTAPPGVTGAPEALVDVVVTPVGSDFNNATPRTASLRLVPQGVVLPPLGLTPDFELSPTNPVEDQIVLFDASRSTPANGIVSYSWSFGDGGTASGKTATHSYSDPGNYAATLTITDEFGRSASRTRTVTVLAGTNPTADFTVSPTDPRAGQAVNFNASASAAASGRRIVTYIWDFGDGDRTESGSPIASHAYGHVRTFTVVLTVVDDAGRRATVSKTVTVLPAAAP